MNALSLVPRNLKQFERNLEAEDKKRKVAASIAVRVEVNRLRLRLKEELRDGAPGGQRLTPLSVVGRMLKMSKAQRRIRRKPLARLAIPVRYWQRQTAGGQVYSVGFQGGPVTGLDGSVQKKNQLSRSWVRLAMLHQDGGAVQLQDKQRQIMLKQGYFLKKIGDPAARFFLLRKSTRFAVQPRRPIIDPFWVKHRAASIRNINKNFHDKMAGVII